MNYMYHFTRDGKYVDGVHMDGRAETPQLRLLAEKYEGCHTWVLLSGPAWYSNPSNGLSSSRWTQENTQYVPECVRTAEYVRDK